MKRIENLNYEENKFIILERGIFIDKIKLKEFQRIIFSERQESIKNFDFAEEIVLKRIYDHAKKYANSAEDAYLKKDEVGFYEIKIINKIINSPREYLIFTKNGNILITAEIIFYKLTKN
jgi:hypothetical protein